MIGILPAAGNATRIHGLPKYLLPVPGGFLLQAHVDAMKAAGCRKVFIGANEHNLELIEYHTRPDAQVVVYLAEQRDTMTQTVLSGQRYAEVDTVLFGMPDSYWSSGQFPYSFLANMSFLRRKDVKAILHCAQARLNQWKRGGMCDIAIGGQVTRIVDKPEITETPWIWGAMRWEPGLWQYFKPDDSHVGFGVQRAIEGGEHIHATVQWEGDYWDCGTYEEYFECIQHLMSEKVLG